MADSSTPALSLKIPKAHIRKSPKGNEIVFYEIRSSRRVAVHSKDAAAAEGAPPKCITDVAFKRFSDFVLLDNKLHKNFPLLTNLPVLPPKKMFGNLDPRFVEKRRQELEAYLTALVEHQGAPGMVGIIPGTQGNLLQASQDLKAFVPQGYLKDQLEDLLRFEVIEVNTFGLNRPMQLTVQPTAFGVLQFRDASGSGGLDSQANKIVIAVADILAAGDVEGSHVRAAISYTEDAGAAKYRDGTTTPARSAGGAPRGHATPASAVGTPAVHGSSFLGPSSLASNSSSSHRMGGAGGEWAEADPMLGQVLNMEPAGSPTAASASSSSTSAAQRSRKKVLEFASFEDRHRFVRLCRWLKELSDAAKRRGSNSSTGSGPESSPSSLALHPTSSWASVFVTSWNQAKEPEPDDLSNWLPKDGGNFDLLAVGTQECPTTLAALTEAVARHFGDRYYLVGSKVMWEIKLMVFARTELALGSVIHCVETDSVALGILGIGGNKGGVGVSFKIHNLAVCFINTHLAPHMERYADRNRMFEDVDRDLKVGVCGRGLGDFDCSVKFDTLFWLGDLNYRLEMAHQEIVELANARAFDQLMPKDQLRRAQWGQEAFTGYSEGVLKFPPTYKYIMPKKKGKGAAGARGRGESQMQQQPQQQQTTTPTNSSAAAAEYGGSSAEAIALSASSSSSSSSSASSDGNSSPLLKGATSSSSSNGGGLPSVSEEAESEPRVSTASARRVTHTGPPPFMQPGGAPAPAPAPTPATTARLPPPLPAHPPSPFRATPPPLAGAGAAAAPAPSASASTAPPGLLPASRPSALPTLQRPLSLVVENDVSSNDEEEEEAEAAARELSSDDMTDDDEEEDEDDHDPDDDEARSDLSADNSVVAGSSFLPSMLSATDAAIYGTESSSAAAGDAPVGFDPAPDSPALASTTAPSGASASGSTGAAGDLDDAAVFDSLDPDFSAYSRQRVRHTVLPSGAAPGVSPHDSPNASVSAHTGAPATQPTAAAAAPPPALGSFASLAARPLPIPPQPQPQSQQPAATSAASSAPGFSRVPPPPPASAPPLPKKQRPSMIGSAVLMRPAPSSSSNSGSRRTSSGLVGDSASSVFARQLIAEQQQGQPAGPFGARRSFKGDGSRRRSATVPGAPKKRVFNRTYGKKRIPSWCDRILFRTHHPELARLKSYYRCDLVATSDHIPVVATFEMRVPLCPPLAAYSYPASLIFSSLSLDITVHPSRLGGASRGDRPASLDFLDKIYVVFSGSLLAEPSRGKRTGFATLRHADGTPLRKGQLQDRAGPPRRPAQTDGDALEADLRPTVVLASWDELEVPILQCVLGARDFIASERVFFAIKSGDELGGAADLVLGQGHIALQSLQTFFSAAATSAAASAIDGSHTGSLAAMAAHHISYVSGSGLGKPTQSPFALTLSDGQDGSVGLGCGVRSPPQSGMLKECVPAAGGQRNAWSFCSLVERHSAASGTLQGNIFVNMERPEEAQPKKSEEQMIQEVLRQE